MPPPALPLLLIEGEPLARFCQRWRFPPDRMANRSPGEWWLFLFLTRPGPLLDSLESLLGIRQLDAMKPFLSSTDWRQGTEDGQKDDLPHRQRCAISKQAGPCVPLLHGG